MTFEVIDVVDENDNVIGTIERTPEWNAKRSTIHRFINVLAKLSDGRFVMQQRAKHKSKPLVFDFAVGGVVPTGLTYEQAAQKELQEELGLIEKVDFVAEFQDFNGTDKVSAFAQLFEVTSDGPFSGWEVESERLEFFTLDELNHMTQRFPYMFTSGFLTGWSVYRQTKNI